MLRSMLMFLFLVVVVAESVGHGHGDADELKMSCLESDREALLDFKNGLQDPHNRLSSWKGSNCCQWWGISCEDTTTGAVTHVDLHNPHPPYVPSGYRKFHQYSSGILPNYLDEEYEASTSRYGFWNLSGEIRPSLMKLRSLKYLDLSFNTFKGISIPKFFGSFQNLQYINLSNAGFTGPIPSNIGNLSSLQCLDLSYNRINSKIPDWLVNVSTLTTIDLSDCNLDGRIPLGLAKLPNLKILRLADNDLSASTSQLLRGRWEKIQIVDLGANYGIHGKLPASIGNLTSLTYLNLQASNVQGGIPSSVGKLCNLKFLWVSESKLRGTLPESLEAAQNCASRSPLSSLLFLQLSWNYLGGRLPEWLGQLENLIELGLSGNLLNGPIPDSLHLLQNLEVFFLSENRLNGTLPKSLGQLPELLILDLNSNYLAGVVTETHFIKHTKLRYLDLSFNSLSLDISSTWVPPFQTLFAVRMSSCHLLHQSFPAWLKSLKRIDTLSFSNASISGSIPYWFWEISPSLHLLNFSFNQLEGQLPSSFKVNGTLVDFSYNLLEGPIPLPVGAVLSLDLSNNKFSGSIPKNMTNSFPYLSFLSLAGNQIKGEIPASIGNTQSLEVLDLSSNYLTGIIPPSIGNCSRLMALDLSNNNLYENIPSSLGQLKFLETLHLCKNKLSGTIPSSFWNLSSLTMLDLKSNKLVGRIPRWIGEGFEKLKFLSLRSNAFFGEIPSTLSNLSSLQVLDLAKNQLDGTISSSFGDFKFMTQVQNNMVQERLYYGDDFDLFYEESMVVNMKGQPFRYNRSLSLVISMDLSGNNLSGDFPVEITKLLGLLVLNLSGNHISGYIPVNISKLRQLLSLDLSNNRLSGPIPESLSSLSFLQYLDLSSNGFFGMIPYAGHLTTFETSSFAENPGLCGAPLDVKCPGDYNDSRKKWNFKDKKIDEDIKWLYLSVGLGFAAGLVVPFLLMAMRKSWSIAYFDLVDKVFERMPLFTHKRRSGVRFQRG